MNNEKAPTTFESVATEDLLHPDDAQYIWIPFLVLVCIFILAALVYAMSRSQRYRLLCFCCKRKNATRHGYIRVDDDSDVPMACGDDFGEDNDAACLLNGRLHIESRNERFQTMEIKYDNSSHDFITA